jgi:hypothetical protein
MPFRPPRFLRGGSTPTASGSEADPDGSGQRQPIWYQKIMLTRVSRASLPDLSPDTPDDITPETQRLEASRPPDDKLAGAPAAGPPKVTRRTLFSPLDTMGKAASWPVPQAATKEAAVLKTPPTAMPPTGAPSAAVPPPEPPPRRNRDSLEPLAPLSATSPALERARASKERPVRLPPKVPPITISESSLDEREEDFSPTSVSPSERRISRAEIYAAQYRELAAATAAAAMEPDELSTDFLPSRATASAEEVAATRAAVKAEAEVEAEAEATAAVEMEAKARAEVEARAKVEVAEAAEAEERVRQEAAQEMARAREMIEEARLELEATQFMLEMEKETRITHAQEMAVRRLTKQHLSRAWNAWREDTSMKRSVQRTLRASAARLLRPAKSASFAHWRCDWETAAREHAASEWESSAQEAVDKAYSDAMQRVALAEAAAQEQAERARTAILEAETAKAESEVRLANAESEARMAALVAEKTKAEAEARATKAESDAKVAATAAAAEAAVAMRTAAKAEADAAVNFAAAVARAEANAAAKAEEAAALAARAEAAAAVKVEEAAGLAARAEAEAAAKVEQAAAVTARAEAAAAVAMRAGAKTAAVRSRLLLFAVLAVAFMPWLVALDARATLAVRKAASGVSAGIGPVLRHRQVEARTRALSVEASNALGHDLTPKERLSQELPIFALVSAQEQSCLLNHPLRFGPCDDDDLLLYFLSGRRLHPVYADSLLRQPTWVDGPLQRLPPVASSESSSTIDDALSVQAAAEASQFRICVDRRCIRCLARGNANRVRVGLCAFEGFEGLHVAPALALSTVDHILGLVSLSQLLCVLIALLALVRWGARHSMATYEAHSAADLSDSARAVAFA